APRRGRAGPPLCGVGPPRLRSGSLVSANAGLGAAPADRRRPAACAAALRQAGGPLGSERPVPAAIRNRRRPGKDAARLRRRDPEARAGLSADRALSPTLWRLGRQSISPSRKCTTRLA